MLHRHNQITPEVQSLVDELKCIQPKDRKKVPNTLCIIPRVYLFRSALASWLGGAHESVASVIYQITH